MKELTIDDVYDKIGHLGRAQRFYVLSLCLLQIFGCHHMLLNIYTGLHADFTCKSSNDNKIEKVLHNKCFNNSILYCENQAVVYNESSYNSYIVEWNFICNKKYKVAMVQTVWMGGVMTGALVLGGLADWIGRIKTLFIAITGTIAFEGFSAFSKSYELYLISRFAGGMSVALIILSSFVLTQELIGASKRSLCGIGLGMFFSVGIGLLSLLSAYMPDWRMLTFLVSIEGILFIYIPFVLPESPRWLSSQGKLDEAKLVLLKLADGNQTSHLLPRRWELHKPPGKKSVESAKTLFSNQYIAMLTLIQIYSWFVNSLVYYSLTMAAGSLPGNVYVVTTLNGLVEIPAFILTIFIIDRYGRRKTVSNFMLLGGVICLIIPLAATVIKNSVNTLVLIAKMSSSASFAIIYVHSGEIFPTVIRNTGMGVVSVAARIGGMISPFVLMMGDYLPYMHFVTLGSLSILGGLLSTFLPETLGKPMPETVSDILAMREEPNSLTEKVGQGYSRLPQHIQDDGSEDEIYNTRNKSVTKEI